MSGKGLQWDFVNGTGPFRAVVLRFRDVLSDKRSIAEAIMAFAIKTDSSS